MYVYTTYTTECNINHFNCHEIAKQPWHVYNTNNKKSYISKHLLQIGLTTLTISPYRLFFISNSYYDVNTTKPNINHFNCHELPNISDNFQTHNKNKLLANARCKNPTSCHPWINHVMKNYSPVNVLQQSYLETLSGNDISCSVSF